MSFESIWQVPDAQVASGRIPGYVGALRIGGEIEVRAGGRMALDGPPMREDTLFRIASVTKPIGGALTLLLIERGVLGLDDPIARWLPEAAAPRVLVAPDAPLDDTVAAVRPISVRHLMTMTCGWGAVLSSTPLQAEMIARGVYSGALPHPMSADAFVAGVCSLPLAFQPGEGWLYDTAINLLGVLLMRATGRSLTSLLDEFVFGPLGLSDTAFWTADPSRLATAYKPGPTGLVELDPPDGRWASPPAFEELNGGLLSTAGDLLRIYSALADDELLAHAPMIADALDDEQRAQAFPIIEPGGSWGLATGLYPGGAWGWEGGTGTTAHVDPVHDAVGVLLTQRTMQGPTDAFPDFWAAVAQA